MCVGGKVGECKEDGTCVWVERWVNAKWMALVCGDLGPGGWHLCVGGEVGECKVDLWVGGEVGAERMAFVCGWEGG